MIFASKFKCFFDQNLDFVLGHTGAIWKDYRTLIRTTTNDVYRDVHFHFPLGDVEWFAHLMETVLLAPLTVESPSEQWQSFQQFSPAKDDLFALCTALMAMQHFTDDQVARLSSLAQSSISTWLVPAPAEASRPVISERGHYVGNVADDPSYHSSWAHSAAFLDAKHRTELDGMRWKYNLVYIFSDEYAQDYSFHYSSRARGKYTVEDFDLALDAQTQFENSDFYWDEERKMPKKTRVNRCSSTRKASPFMSAWTYGGRDYRALDHNGHGFTQWKYYSGFTHPAAATGREITDDWTVRHGHTHVESRDTAGGFCIQDGLIYLKSVEACQEENIRKSGQPKDGLWGKEDRDGRRKMPRAMPLLEVGARIKVNNEQRVKDLFAPIKKNGELPNTEEAAQKHEGMGPWLSLLLGQFGDMWDVPHGKNGHLKSSESFSRTQHAITPMTMDNAKFWIYKDKTYLFSLPESPDEYLEFADVKTLIALTNDAATVEEKLKKNISGT